VHIRIVFYFDGFCVLPEFTLHFQSPGCGISQFFIKCSSNFYLCQADINMKSGNISQTGTQHTISSDILVISLRNKC
jgi:hypothetical protein